MSITELGYVGVAKCLMEKKIEDSYCHSQAIWAQYL